MTGEMVTATQIAARLGVGIPTVSNWHRRPAKGFPKPVIPPRARQWDWDEIEQWYAERTASTWTFMGHWDNDRIVVEYYVPGEIEDPREDTGYWEQGLWAAAGSGATAEEAMAAVIAEYEDQS